MCNLNLSEPFTVNIFWQYIDHDPIIVHPKHPDFKLSNIDDRNRADNFLLMLDRSLMNTKGDFMLDGLYKIANFSDTQDSNMYLNLISLHI